MNPTTKPTGYVYIVIGDNSQHIKIGYSGNPEKRLKSLQTGTAEKLSIAKTWIAWKADESRIHRKLAQYRKHHEWFDLDVQSASLHISALLGRSDSPILKQSDLVVIQTGFLMKWHSDVTAVSQDLLWDIVAVMDKLRQFRDAKRTAGQVKKYLYEMLDNGIDTISLLNTCADLEFLASHPEQYVAIHARYIASILKPIGMQRLDANIL